MSGSVVRHASISDAVAGPADAKVRHGRWFQQPARVLAGAAAIAQTGISGAQQAVAYRIFALIATMGVAAPW
jgi:hypothetical protein